MFEDSRLKIFLTVASCGSFTVAARKLGITQPAVSQSMTALEKSLGAKLFERNRGEVRLTDKGRAMQVYASRILYWYDSASRMFGPEGKAAEGASIRLQADSFSAGHILPDAMSILLAAHPGLNFTVTDSADGADARISVLPTPKSMDFEHEASLVGTIDAAVVASPLNRTLAGAPDAPVKPFSTLEGIHVSNRFAVWSGYSGFLSPDMEARTAAVSVSAAAVETLTAGSDRIVGIVPEIAVRGGISAGTLLKMPVSLPEFTLDVHFVSSPDFAGKKVCALLLETIKQLL